MQVVQTRIRTVRPFWSTRTLRRLGSQRRLVLLLAWLMLLPLTGFLSHIWQILDIVNLSGYGSFRVKA